jgi:hypothetical protein
MRIMAIVRSRKRMSLLPTGGFCTSGVGNGGENYLHDGFVAAAVSKNKKFVVRRASPVLFYFEKYLEIFPS